MKIKLAFLTITFFAFGCTTPLHSTYSVKASELQQIIKQKKYSILFFWTSWSGVSKSIIPRTYVPLADSFRKEHIDASIVLLCGSSGMDSLVKAFNLPRLKSYYINKSGNGIPIIDRLKIKSYLQNLFPKYNFKSLKGSFTYGIPVTIIVDSNMNVITDSGPQDIENLLNIVCN